MSGSQHLPTDTTLFCVMGENEGSFTRRAEVLVHTNPWWNVYLDEVGLPDGSPGRHMRMVPSSRKPGVVVLATRNAQSGLEMAFVKQHRYAAGATLIELPRGFAKASDRDAAASALREFSEETGHQATSVKVLGEVLPDSSIIESRITVCWLQVEDLSPSTQRDGEVTDVLWFPETDVRQMVAAGELEDGFSLAALALWWAAAH